MTEVLKGKTLDEARRLFAEFHAKVTGSSAEACPRVARKMQSGWSH